ncbi:uncharacterized protein LOC109838043 isoform X4 [Asparagus officinalis]|uniref:uncharacterized protein LOC109838043 isoform X4 n=1 Tax=Asparagus officinalis TaxID=4686 RepID=UPI00098E5985|nr:uncharacterized protein LOC109838043 isoform X4 [Asparagus officinalis]
MPPRKRSRADSSSSQELSDTDIDRPIILARIVGLNVHFERGFQISALQTSIYTYHVNCSSEAMDYGGSQNSVQCGLLSGPNSQSYFVHFVRGSSDSPSRFDFMSLWIS